MGQNLTLDVIDKINEFRLCEYLNDFTANREYDILKNIERCKNSLDSKKENYNIDFNKVNNNLTKQFENNLSEDEQAALILYTSIYKDLFDLIMSIPNY